jgi:hypothetical protein
LFKQNYSKNATRKAELLRNRAQSYIEAFMEEQRQLLAAKLESRELQLA